MSESNERQEVSKARGFQRTSSPGRIHELAGTLLLFESSSEPEGSSRHTGGGAFKLICAAEQVRLKARGCVDAISKFAPFNLFSLADATEQSLELNKLNEQLFWKLQHPIHIFAACSLARASEQIISGLVWNSDNQQGDARQRLNIVGS